ncbi:TetR family transcriptional regulator [Grimontia sp. AD028]|uniref:Transcriptional regulator, TetR family n=2 Tax=Grimontia TaxID=246861 RepID=R1GU80_9GAMM|nr:MULTISPECIES: TetR/AcrR family transcriptional regulator [Grimontia]EOD79753.1 Transcriptional regulator, TetR family [Grimontia indica]KKD58003.1 TetR family transcriptional regulator [Grimontia sp. AD028]CZF79729.1 Fatty acid metabolism regulator protein [Grimontia celer]
MLEQTIENRMSAIYNVDTSSLSRKQLAMRDREKELLEIARDVVMREGFAQLTMDKVAAASSYSKGTIYNHFNSKEDLIAALAIEALSRELPMFKRSLAFDGSSREKCIAMHAGYFVFSQLEPILSMCAMVSRTPAVTEKSAPERLEKLNELEEIAVSIGDAFIQNGINSGELVLNPGVTSDNVVFANWAMGFGTNALVHNAEHSTCVSRQLNHNIVLQNINFLLDGLGWKPLSTEFDYEQTWARARKELFSEELALLGQKA